MRKTVTRKNRPSKQKTGYIHYKPFFWKNAIEGEIAGGFPINNKNLNDNKHNSLALDVVNATTHNAFMDGGSATMERFRNLVVPYGFVITREVTLPHKKIIERYEEEIIDENRFDHLFSPLIVNKLTAPISARSKPNKSSRKTKKNH